MTTYDISTYGAVNDGQTLCTRAIQAAIDAAGVAGGRVVVPPGRYRTGTLSLRSQVTLYLAEGAVLAGSEDLADYEYARGWGWPHDERVCDVTPWHLVQAFDAENITICGPGRIEGNGPAFWHDERPHEWCFWRHKENQRPSPMVHLENCRHVTLRDVHLSGSAGWALHLSRCQAAAIRGVTIRNSWFGPNSDGMDIHNCQGVRISDCDIATGDDAIAVMASRHGPASEDIVITNCVLRTSCVGLRVIGFDSGAIHRRIAASNLTIPRCSRVFDIRSQNGTRIEDITIANCTATTNCGWPVNRIAEVVAIDHANPHSHALNPDDTQGLVRNVTFRDIHVHTDGRVILAANDRHRVEQIRIDGLSLRYALLEGLAGPERDPVSNWLDDGLDAVCHAEAAIVARKVDALQIRNLAVSWPSGPVPADWLVMDTPQRFINRPFFAGHETDIRTGALRPDYAVLWAQSVTGRVAMDGLRAAHGGEPACVQDCDLRLD